MSRRIHVLAIALALLAIQLSPANAEWFYATDTSKTGFNIDYFLSYDTGGNAPYSATLRIDDKSTATNFTNEPWSITSVYFKFFEGSPVTALSDIAGYTINNQGGGFWGYVFDTPLVLGNGGPGFERTLNFTFSNGNSLLQTEYVNFKVNYLGGPKSNGGNFTGQYSGGLAIPEPGAFMLLGAGLIGVFTLRRFRK